MLAQIAHTLAELGQLRSSFDIDARLMGDDFRLMRRFRKIELKGNEALPRAMFEVFQNVLITRIVRHHQEKSVGGFDNFAELIDVKQRRGSGNWLIINGRVFAGLTTFVEIAIPKDGRRSGRVKR